MKLMALCGDSLGEGLTMGHRGTDPKRITQLVAAWRASGTASAAFARRHGHHPRTFWGWCRRERDDQGQPSTAAVRFVPVTVVKGTNEASWSDVEIVLASGDRVCVRGGVTAELFAHVVMALRRPC